MQASSWVKVDMNPNLLEAIRFQASFCGLKNVTEQRQRPFDFHFNILKIIKYSCNCKAQQTHLKKISSFLGRMFFEVKFGKTFDDNRGCLTPPGMPFRINPLPMQMQQ